MERRGAENVARAAASAGDPVEANALFGAPSTTLEAWCQGNRGGRATLGAPRI